MVYVDDFTYNSKSLSDFDEDFCVVSFEDNVNNGDVTVLGRSVDRSEIRYDQPITFDYGATETGVYTFSITIARDSGNPLTQADVRQFVSWLMSPVTPQWLTLTGKNTDIYNGVFFKGRFVRAAYEDIGVAKKIGIKFEFENISSYGFTREYTYNITSTAKTPGNLTIENPGTFVGKSILPIITITPTDGGVVTIQNTAVDKDPLSISVTNGTAITLQDYYCLKSDGNFYDFENFNNFNWVVLVDGTNTIKVTGACTVQIKTRFYEAVGV